MPELPEVETLRRQLCQAGVEGRVIEAVHVEWARTVSPMPVDLFCKALQGKVLYQINRHGKWLIVHLSEGDPLWIHLRMTGGFTISEGALKKGPYDRIILQLSGKMNLHFRDPRKFGRWRQAPSMEGLGPDALTVTQKQFMDALKPFDKTLKALLLDQSFIAGVGNIYGDEALFRARLNPCRKSGALRAAERVALWSAVRHVIEAGVRNKGTSLGTGQGNYVDLNGESGGHSERVQVYGCAGQPCTVCQTPLQKIQIAQRTTVFCPSCQK